MSKPTKNWPLVDVEWWGRTITGGPVEGSAVFEWLGGHAVDPDPAWPVTIVRKSHQVAIDQRVMSVDGETGVFGYFKTRLPASNIDAVIGSKAPWRCTIKPSNAESMRPWEFWADVTASPIQLPRVQPVTIVFDILPVPIPTWGDVTQLRSQVAALAEQVIAGGGSGSASITGAPDFPYAIQDVVGTLLEGPGADYDPATQTLTLTGVSYAQAQALTAGQQAQALSNLGITPGGTVEVPLTPRVVFLKDDGTWPVIPTPTEVAPVLLFDNPAALPGSATIPDPPSGVLTPYLRQVGGRPWASEAV